MSATILAVDDDPVVLRAIVRDLRTWYGADHRGVTAPSGAEALAVAAGDVRLRSRRRVASAVGEGAMSAYRVHRYLAMM